MTRPAHREHGVLVELSEDLGGSESRPLDLKSNPFQLPVLRRQKGQATTMMKALSLIGTSAMIGSMMMLFGGTPAGASADQGVTAKTITVGVPYVDLHAVDLQFGLKINQGSYQDAYTALFDQINARGGINGRTIKPVFVAVNPTGTAAAATACTQLTEDTHVFVAFAPESPICYLENGTPTIGSTVAGSVSNGAAQNFTVIPPATAYDPLQLGVLAKKGTFKNKKVGVFGGTVTDEPEVKVVDAALKKEHVDVVQNAVDSAPSTDQTASDQQQAIIAQRFQSSGVNEVVAVGSGSALWLQAENSNQASYDPPWIATSEAELDGVLTGATYNAKYLENVITTYPLTSTDTRWSDPAIQQCVRTIKKAFPSNPIDSPVGQSATDKSHETYISAMNTCQYVAIFDAIAKAAGRHLTVASFTHAGYGLRNLKVPGAGTVSFGPGQAYALGPVYLAHYDPATNLLTLDSKPAS